MARCNGGESNGKGDRNMKWKWVYVRVLRVMIYRGLNNCSRVLGYGTSYTD